MQTNILWTGREYHSVENCLVSVSDAGVEAASTILGTYQQKIYKVEYLLRANQNWETTFLEIRSRRSDYNQLFQLESDCMGSWKLNGENAEELKGCIDVDIPLTPFTNTLPINRLHLSPNNAEEIQVVYCDLLEGRIKSVRQKYTSISKTQYHYQNIPNDFEAIIVVDGDGFVVDYPSLFVRTAAVKAQYG
jgi:uncharacterized protein